jgi:flagellar motor switch protein FliM
MPRGADHLVVPTTVSRHDEASDAKVRTFDFRRPNKLSRDHVRSLQIVHETFARQLTTLFSSSLRVVSEVNILSIEQLSYDEYVRDTPNPSHLSILSIDPLPGVAIFQLPLSTAMTVVDLMLGGHGVGAGPDRPLTEIERGLVRTMIDRALAELAYSFESITKITPQVIQHESNPQFAQIAAPSDMTVVVMFEVKVGAEENVASLCFPYAALQPILDTIAQAAMRTQVSRTDSENTRSRLSARLLDVPVEMIVEFNEASLTSGEILDLAVGDVIALNHAIDVPLTASVDGVATFEVRPARSGKRLACQVVGLADPHHLHPGASR